MKSRTNRVILAGASLAGAIATLAQTAAPPETPAPSWTITPAFASQYMFRGVRLGGPSFQPAIEFDHGSLALGGWCNVPISDKVDGQSDPEVDFYGSYSIDVIKRTLNIAPGFTLYTYPNAARSQGFYKATVEPNIAANYTVGMVRLTPKIYYDVVLDGPTYELSAATAIPLKGAGTELDFIATAGTYRWTTAVPDVTPDIKNWGDYWLVGVTVPFQINSSSKLTLGFAYTAGSNNFYKQGIAPRTINPRAVGHGVVTVSYGFTF